MNVEELVTQFRSDADDAAAPFLWSAEEVLRWLDEAQQEAALRGRLLMETSNPAITQIPLLAGVATYLLHKSLYELTKLRCKTAGDTRSEWVALVTRMELDRMCPDWRDSLATWPLKFAIQDEKTLTLSPPPDRSGTLYLEGYRLPLLTLDEEGKVPEISTAHHRHLVQWALHRAFSKPDAETMDPQRADRAEKEFTRYFGRRPDAGLRRETQHNTPQHNRAW